MSMASSAKALSFDQRVQSELPPTRVWELLTAALSGDEKNGLWPTRYSTISGQVVEGGQITEVVFGWSKIRYRLSNVVAGKRLTYSPLPGEPMVGRSHIEVQESLGGGSVIHWFGTYEVSALSPRGIVLRLYEQLFFHSFERNLRRIARCEVE